MPSDDSDIPLPLLGDRVKEVGGDHTATVKYVGDVDGSKGVWIGLEWDDPERGRHDGIKDGKRYFHVVGGPKAGSFVRPKKIHNGVSLQRGASVSVCHVRAGSVPKRFLF